LSKSGPALPMPWVERVGLRIIGRGLPDRPAAVAPVLVAAFPGLIAGFAGAGDRVIISAPGCFSGVEIGRLDETPNPVFTAGSPHDGEVADDERSDGNAQGGVSDLPLLGHFASRLVYGEHAAIERDGDDFVPP
jgi:hypothetical protein